MYIKYDSNPVPVNYSFEELALVIDEYIKATTSEFTFKSICCYIVNKAISEGRVPDAEHTKYSSGEMDPISSIEVSRCLWNLIWDRKIIIAFGYNSYAGHTNGDTRFSINK